MARASRLDGSKRWRIGWNFETFEDAVRLCSIYTREARRQVAYHEAGHAVVAWLLGFSGVWIDMEGGSSYHAIVRYDSLPPLLAVADGGYSILARYLYEDLMFSVAGLVAEARIAGYPADYVEVDVAGRTTVPWDAARVARIEAGLPICGHKDCEIPFDTSPVADAGPDSADPDRAGSVTGRITGEDVAEVIRRAEDEVFDLLQSNWPIVERVVDALCKQDRLTTPELDALIAGPESVDPESVDPDSAGPSLSEPSPPEPTLIGDAA